MLSDEKSASLREPLVARELTDCSEHYDDVTGADAAVPLLHAPAHNAIKKLTARDKERSSWRAAHRPE